MKVLVMGTGSYYQKKKAGIQGDVIAFVDNFKEGEYEEKKIIRPVDTSKYDYDRIYIMEDKKYTLTELVDQLIGPVMPVGDTTIDERYWPFAVKVE